MVTSACGVTPWVITANANAYQMIAFTAAMGFSENLPPTQRRVPNASIPGMTDETVDELIRLRDSGGLTAETLDSVLPATNRDAIKQLLRLKLTSILRVRVEALGSDGTRVIARFDGAAMIGERGVQEVGLRPM